MWVRFTVNLCRGIFSDLALSAHIKSFFKRLMKVVCIHVCFFLKGLACSLFFVRAQVVANAAFAVLQLAGALRKPAKIER